MLKFISMWFSTATLLVVFVVSFPGRLAADEFNDAQVAATKGQYDEVVSILTVSYTHLTLPTIYSV